jgi:hypothetical protein
MADTDTEKGFKLPSLLTLQTAAKLSIVEDKPIMMDYWTSSLEKKSVIGFVSKEVRYLRRSSEEYTSLIVKFYQVGDDFIISTENSLYIVDFHMAKKKVSIVKDKMIII